MPREPRLQNIPVHTPTGDRVREAFRAQQSGHVFVGLDLNQIELRLLDLNQIELRLLARLSKPGAFDELYGTHRKRRKP